MKWFSESSRSFKTFSAGLLGTGKLLIVTLLVRGLVEGSVEGGQDFVEGIFNLQQVAHLVDGTQSL